MPRFELRKLSDNEYDSDVTLTFQTDLLQSAQLHYEDFLKACGFEFPPEDDEPDDEVVFERRIEATDNVITPPDYMWGNRDGIFGSGGTDFLILDKEKD